MSDLPDAIAHLEVAVVDPDVLWAVDHANALRPRYAETFGTVLEALDRLAGDQAAVAVLGPGAADGAEVDLARLATTCPNVNVVVVLAEVSADRAERLLDAGAEVVVGDDAPRQVLHDAVDEALAAARGAVGGAPGSATGTTGLTPATVVLVTAAKGGEGVSTVAANLAATIAGRGHEVALVDCDPNFGDLALLLGMPAPPVVEDPAELVPGPTALRRSIAVQDETGVRLAGLPRLRDDFTILPFEAVTAVLQAVAGEVDVVVLDAPFHAVMHGAYTRVVDQLVFVTRPPLTSLKNAAIALDALGARDRLSVVVNRLPEDDARRHRRRHGTADLARLPEPDEIADVLGHPVTAVLVDDEEIPRLAGSGTLPVQVAPSGPFAEAIGRLTAALALPTAT